VGSETATMSDEAVAGLLAAAAAGVVRGQEPTAAWAERVVEAAEALAGRFSEAQRRLGAARLVSDTTRTLVGRVVEVKNPATSQGGKRLTFALVSIKSAIGQFADTLWVDLRAEGGSALAARCEQLVHQEVTFTRRQVVEMAGDQPKVENGEVVTRPRLVTIEPSAGTRGPTSARAAAPGAPADAVRDAGVGGPGPTSRAAAPPSGAGAAPGAAPATSAEVVQMAGRLGWRIEEIQAVSAEIFGPKTPGTKRTPEEIARLWAVLVERTGRGAEPATMRELVDRAREQLGLSLSEVRAVSDAVLGPKVEGQERTAGELAALWRAVLVRRSQPAVEPAAVPA